VERRTHRSWSRDRVFGVSSQLTFEEFNIEDMRGHLGELGVPRGKQDEVLSDWDANRKAAVVKLRPYLAMLRHQEAERKLFEAQNESFLNELYFPDEVISALNALYKELHDWLIHRRHPELRDEWKPDHARATKTLQAVHELLRSYVGIGAAELVQPPSLPDAAARSLPSRPELPKN
jgi:hypothetical protein